MLRTCLVAALLSGTVLAQTVQPVIQEYKGHADGKLAVTNNSDSPMVVVLEPKSFSITQEGRGIFRPLDPGIHVELSRMSVRLQPKQTYYIFYKASAAVLPAWFTVYATFSDVTHSDGVDVRIMLPHTVYLYQKDALTEGDVHVMDASYSVEHKKLTCTLVNAGSSLARVQGVHATGSHGSAESAGFPFLPGGRRRVEIDWTDKEPPSEIDFRFEHFTLRHPVSIGENSVETPPKGS